MSADSRTIALDEKTFDAPSSSIPERWNLHVHPQGNIYFSNGRIVVDQDIRDPAVYSRILYHASDFNVEEWEDGMELQLNVSVTTGECNFSLYINHTHCIAAYELDKVNSDTVQCLDPETLNRRRRLYWNFLWTHPTHVKSCPARAVPDACDALAWFYTDNLISGTKSVVPFSKDECEELLKRVKDLDSANYENSPAKVAFLSWLLREICSFRNAELYGQHPRHELQKIRRDRERKPPLTSRPAKFLLPVIHLIMNVGLFGIPYTYMRHVKQSFEYRGRLAGVQANWERYIERLVREYSHFLLIATVLLSATVGLLAVPGVSKVAQTAILVSAFSSLGSIIVGVFAIWRHQANLRTIDSFTYMRNAQQSTLGFHGHAMLLSLPPVLLVWAIITFTVSTVAYAVDNLGSSDTIDRVALVVVLVVFGGVLSAVLAAIYTLSMMWTFGHEELWWTRLRRACKKLWERKNARLPLVLQDV